MDSKLTSGLANDTADFIYNHTILPNQQKICFIDLNPLGSQVIVLLHGLGTNGSSWQLQFDTLTAMGYRVIAPDLPGFGKSGFTGKHWSIREAARLILSLIDTLSIPCISLAGISMGGVISLQLALDYPKRVKKLVLVNTFASMHPDKMNGWFYLLRRFLIVGIRGAPAQANLVANRLFPEAGQEQLRQVLIGQIRQTDRKVYRAAMVSLGLFDARRHLKEITIPTLVISGMNDTTVPLRSQAAMAAGIPGAKHVLLPSAGHAVIVDQPGEFNETLRSFLYQDRAVE